MRLYKPDELKRTIKAGKIAPVYFLFGNESYLITHYTNMIIKSVVSGPEELNVKYYDTNLDVNEIYSNAYQVPMLSPKKCIIISDCDFEDCDSQELKLFEEMVTTPSDVAVVIFRYTGMDLSFKKTFGSKNTKKRDKIISSIESNGGMVVEINHMTLGDIVKTICSGVRKRNCSIDPRVANYMVEICSDDLTALLTEVEKLCSYVGQGEITKEHIDKICVRSVNAIIYDMSKAVLSNDVKKSMSILNDLLFLNVKPDEILREMANNYIDIYRISAANQSGVNMPEVVSDFGYGNRAFVLKNAQIYSKKLNEKQLSLCLNQLCETDFMLKGGSKMKKNEILEILIIKLISIFTKGDVS